MNILVVTLLVILVAITIGITHSHTVILKNQQSSKERTEKIQAQLEELLASLKTTNSVVSVSVQALIAKLEKLHGEQREDRRD